MPSKLLIDDLIGADAGTLGARLGTLETATAYASLLRPSWSALLALSATAEGQTAEVADSDTGSHGQATATGYTGASVPNAGRYAWSVAWSRWLRVAETRGAERLPLGTAFAFPAARGNLFRYDNALFGHAVNNTTGVTPFAGYAVSGDIPVLAGGAVTLARAEASLNSSYGLEFCDRHGMRVSFLGGPFAAWQVVPVPAGAAVLRFTFRMTAGAPDTDRDTLAVYSGDVSGTAPEAVANTPAFRGEIALTRDSVAAAVSRIGENIWTTAGATDGKAYDSNANKLDTYSGYIASALLPVHGGVPLAVPVGRTGHNAQYGIGWFDAGQSHIGHSAATTIGTDWSLVTPPPDARYMRLSTTHAQKDSFVIRIGARFGLRGCLWEGRKAMILGDSIATTDWFRDMCRASLGMTATRAARGGRRMDKALFADNDSTALTATDFADVALVWLALGINDAIGATPLGTLSDPTSAATFYGQTKKAVEQILTWNPEVRLVIQTLLKTSSAWADAGAHDAALRAVADYYSLPLADLRGESGIGPHNIASVTGDGLHPNATGYARHIVPTARARILGLMPAGV